MHHNPVTGFRSFSAGTRLEIITHPAAVDTPKEPLRTGYAHLAFSLASAEAVDALHAVASSPRTTGDGYYESVVVATENNLTELTA